MKFARTALPAVLFAFLVACGGDDSKQAKAPPTTETTYGTTTSTTTSQPSGAMTGSSMTGTPGSDTTGMSGAQGSATGTMGGAGASATAGGPDTSGSAGMAGATGSTTFTDEEIAAIVATVDSGEIEEGKLAQKKAKDARVKKFAATMVNHHSSSSTKQNDMMKKTKLSPSENSTSRELKTDGQNTIESLKNQTGTDFDKAYIDAQVREHQKVLTMLDDKLIPQAKSSELKAHLQTVRSTVDSHLREAMDIQKTLASK